MLEVITNSSPYLNFKKGIYFLLQTAYKIYQSSLTNLAEGYKYISHKFRHSQSPIKRRHSDNALDSLESHQNSALGSATVTVDVNSPTANEHYHAITLNGLQPEFGAIRFSRQKTSYSSIDSDVSIEAQPGLIVQRPKPFRPT